MKREEHGSQSQMSPSSSSNSAMEKDRNEKSGSKTGQKEEPSSSKMGQKEQPSNSKMGQKEEPSGSRMGQREQSGSGSKMGQGETSKSGSQTTVGATSSSSVNLTNEQKTKIRSTVLTGSAPRVNNVNFSLSVGTVVPSSVHVVEVPPTLIEIHPQWRGYRYFVVNDEIVIVEPDSLKIVAVLTV